MAIGIVSTEEPFTVPTMGDDRIFHIRHGGDDGFRFRIQADPAAKSRIIPTILDEHAADENGFCHRAFAGTESLE